jgi:dihydroorotate dehydrogenase (fumarate)
VAAIVMHSLFEEQLAAEQLASDQYMSAPANSFAEALTYLPEPNDYRLGPDEYLEQIRKVKSAVKVPVIGSLNGITPRGWLDYAKQIQAAGADAIELNVYQLAMDPSCTAETLESNAIKMVSMLKAAAKVPVAVKLSPFYTSLASFAARLDQAGADGLVLFNRFYQPDINLEELALESRLQLSTSSELLLRLRWLAAISGRVKASLIASGGVHSAEDAIKAVMAGAHGVQVVSAVLEKGPEHIGTIVAGMKRWFEEHQYESLRQAQGSMNLSRSPNPRIYERANYLKLLAGWDKAIPAKRQGAPL